MKRQIIAVCSALALAAASALPAVAADAPAEWDGLVQVKAKRFDKVYLLPGADFRDYAKVQLDPTEVAFRKNWQRDYNTSTVSLSSRISDEEAADYLAKVRTGFETAFRKVYADAGVQIVDAPGPDVLRVRTAVANLYVAAPDRMTAGRSRTYSREAGEATIIIEVRDSMTGALLGRAVDRRTTGDTGPYIRNSVTNTSDFTRLFSGWAKSSVEGLAALKAMPPIPAAN